MTQRDLAEMVRRRALPTFRRSKLVAESPSDALLRNIAEVLECDFDEFLLTARRVPPDLLDTFAADPRQSLRFLREWKSKGP